MWWGLSECECTGHSPCLQSWHNHSPCTSEAAGSCCRLLQQQLGKEIQTHTLKWLARVGRGPEVSPLLKTLGLPAARCSWEPLWMCNAQAGSLPVLPLFTIVFSGASARSMKQHLPLLPTTHGVAFGMVSEAGRTLLFAPVVPRQSGVSC